VERRGEMKKETWGGRNKVGVGMGFVEVSRTSWGEREQIGDGRGIFVLRC